MPNGPLLTLSQQILPMSKILVTRDYHMHTHKWHFPKGEYI